MKYLSRDDTALIFECWEGVRLEVAGWCRHFSKCRDNADTFYLVTGMALIFRGSGVARSVTEPAIVCAKWQGK